MKKTILMLVAALFVLIAVNAQTRKVTPRIRKSGNPAQVIKGKTVPIRSRQADKRKVHSNYSTSRRGTWNDTEKEEETELSIFSAEYRYNEEIKGDFENGMIDVNSKNPLITTNVCKSTQKRCLTLFATVLLVPKLSITIGR